MSDSILRCKSKDFAKQIVFLCRDTKTKTKESVLTNQLLRSGTSIGANVYEAQYAQGKKDFISKLEIAQKECFETEYWLELLFETGYIAESTYKPLQNQECWLHRLIRQRRTADEKMDQRKLCDSAQLQKEGASFLASIIPKRLKSSYAGSFAAIKLHSAAQNSAAQKGRIL